MSRRIDPVELELIAYLSDALDPGERQRLEARLRVNAALRSRLSALREPRPWSFPAPSRPDLLRGAAMDLRLHTEPDRAPGVLSPGAVLGVDVGPVADPEAWTVVLLERTDEGWRALSPGPGAMAPSLARFAPGPDGSRHLPLRAPEAQGRYDWVVVLCPASVIPAWEAPDPWETLKEAVAAGAAPTLPLSFEVA